MTREKEIQKASMIIADGQVSSKNFIQGAIWADEHPKEGLWDSGKVIKWLRSNIDNYANYNVKTDDCFVNDFEEDLIKAMEENNDCN